MLRAGAGGASQELAAISRDALQPALVRASALARMPSDLVRTPAAMDAVKQALATGIRSCAVPPWPRSSRFHPTSGADWPAPLLSDPARLVRIEAARVLAPVRPETLDKPSRAAHELAAAEFVVAQRTNDDRPESRTNLGTYFATAGG